VSATHARNIPEIVRPVLGILGIRVDMPSEAAWEDNIVPGDDMQGVKTSPLSVELPVALLGVLAACCKVTGTMLGPNSGFRGGGAFISGANSEPFPYLAAPCTSEDWKLELRGSK
jgi:hypothetical protein